jgi:hypothetical protein
MVKHPKAHRKTVKVRKKLISKPAVKSFKDFPASGLIRVLDREKDKFPEFALYSRARNKTKVEKALRDADFKEEGETHGKRWVPTGKWVLRTDRFSIFVYV